MSVEQNKATLKRMYEEVYNKGNLSLAPELVAPGYHFGERKGPDGWKEAVVGWRTAFPDVHFTVDSAVGEGDWIAYRLSVEGTFKSKFLNFEPTGEKVKFALAFFSQFEDGKLFTTADFAPPGFQLGPSAEANKANEKRLYDEVWNKGEFSLIPELVSPNFVYGENKGHEGYQRMVTSMRAMFSDYHATIDEMVAQGDSVAYRLTSTGTNTGKLGTLEPTGKKATWTQGLFTRYENGKVAGAVNFTDINIYRQLGVIPPVLTQTHEANKAVVKRYFDEVLNKGNTSLLDELMDENYVMRGPAGQEVIRSREGNKQYFAQGRTMAADLHVAIDEMVAEGDKVAVSGSWEGTNTGPFQGNPPTGKHFKYGYTAVYSFAGGKITGGRIVSDGVSVYQQLGIIPPAFAKAAEANKAVVRRTVEEIWNKGNLSLIPEQIWPDYVSHSSNGRDSRGYEGFRDMVNATRTPFPDVHFQIDQITAEGDRVVCNCTMTGTHLGSIMGIAPTGKKFSVKQSYTTVIRDGKSIESWSIVDGVSLFQQLGITPPGTAEANKTAIRRTMEEIWNKGDLSKVPELVAADYVGHQTVGDVRGQEGFSNMIASARKAVPDLQCKIEDLVVEGDNVVCRYTMTGTDTSGVGGAAPTGKKISLRSMYLTRMKDGKSAETWALSDRLGMYQQLSIAPPTK